MDWANEEQPDHVKLFLLERDILRGCACQKQQREIYSRNAKKGKGK